MEMRLFPAGFNRGFFLRQRGIMFVYFAAGLLLLPLWSGQLDPDGISYISIARRYLQGDFGGALNGYWGPLLSWALAAFMAAGITPLFAAKLFGLACGAGLLCGLRRLLGLGGCGGKPRAFLLYAFIPVTYSYFCNIISPDLAAALFTVWYLVWLLDRRFLARPCYSVYCGLAGALAFFAKGYALPFFLAHFTLVCAARWRRSPELRAVALNRWLTGVFTFFFVAAPWIIAVSYKYGPVTFATTGRYNTAIVGPGYQGHPINYEGLFAPKDAKALSVWEDPSYIPVRKWSGFSARGFIHQARLIVTNTLSALWIMEVVSIFSLLVLGWIVWHGFKQWRNRAGPDPFFFYLALAVAVYCAGYTLITVRARYLYPVFVILFAGGACGLGALMRSGRVRPAAVWGATAVFAASFLYVPFDNLRRPAEFSSAPYRRLAGELFNTHGVTGGNIASDARWIESLYISYWLNELHGARALFGAPSFRPRHDTGYPSPASRPPRYYGQIRPGSGVGSVMAELASHNIDYLFLWNSPAFSPAGWTEVDGPRANGLRILRRL